MAATDPVELLRNEYQKRCHKNDRYSLRAFARDLGMSAPRLSQLLSRKRPPSPGQVLKVSQSLGLNQRETQRLLSSGLGNHQLAAFQELPLDQYRLMADWHHSAILCLLETNSKSEIKDEKFIARRLGISGVLVNDSLERLTRLKLIQKDDNGYIATLKNLATPTDLPSTALKTFHSQMIRKALESLDSDTGVDRDITGITMAIDKSKLPAAKQMIKEFRRQLCGFLESGDANEVYHLNLQLFPLTKTKSGENA